MNAQSPATVAAIEALASTYLPAPRTAPDALDAILLPPGLPLPVLARFAWIWAHLHEWREDTNPPDEVWDDICGRMAEEGEMGDPTGSLLASHPREWAQAVRNLPKYRHLAAN